MNSIALIWNKAIFRRRFAIRISVTENRNKSCIKKMQNWYHLYCVLSNYYKYFKKLSASWRIIIVIRSFNFFTDRLKQMTSNTSQLCLICPDAFHLKISIRIRRDSRAKKFQERKREKEGPESERNGMLVWLRLRKPIDSIFWY